MVLIIVLAVMVKFFLQGRAGLTLAEEAIE